MTKPDIATTQAVLERWLPAFLDGQRGPVAIYADKPVTWQAATGTEIAIDPTRNDPSFQRLQAVIPDLHRRDTRVEVFAGGWVFQSTIVGTVDGAEVRLPVCLVVRLDDDARIVRFSEYADSMSAAPFARALQPPQ
ncbi:MAG: ketosteroid isomerase-like protein [Glaciecola sp.]|jgi:ketosteroid isomerase-like protein